MVANRLIALLAVGKQLKAQCIKLYKIIKLLILMDRTKTVKQNNIIWIKQQQHQQ